MFLSIKIFTQPALSYLTFRLPLAKSSQQRKITRHCRTSMKSSIAILILRSKNIIVLLLYRWESRARVPILSLTTYPFSIPTDENVPLQHFSR